MALVSLENQKLYVPKRRYSEFELVRVETIYIIKIKKLGEYRKFLLVYSMRSQETHIGQMQEPTFTCLRKRDQWEHLSSAPIPASISLAL